MPLSDEQELIKVRNDRTLQIQFNDEISLGNFGISLSKEFPALYDIAIKHLMAFSTPYLCGLALSALNEIKSKKRERLLSVKVELRVALSDIEPQIKKIKQSKASAYISLIGL